MSQHAIAFLRRATLAAGALSAAFYCIAVSLAGGSAVDFLWYLALTVLLIFLPGAQLCAWLLPRVHGTGRIACAYALGVALLWLNYTAFGLLSGAVGSPLALMFALPVLLCLYFFVVQVRCAFGAQRVRRTCTNADPLHADRSALGISHHISASAALQKNAAPLSPAIDALAFCVCLGVCIYGFTGVFGFAHAFAAGNMQYHQDMLWSVGNGAAVQLGFPLRDIRAAGGVLHYHYLADAVPGFIAFAGGILPFDAVCYYNYPVLLLVLVCAAHAAARAYGASEKVAVALPFALLFLQGFGSDATLNLLRNMNGVIAASALTCTVLYLLFWAEQQGFDKKRGVTAGFYSTFALCMGVLLLSKNLYGILLLCAILAAVFVGGLAQHRLFKAPLIMALLSACLLGLLWVFFFSGAINNLVFEIWQDAWQIPKTLLLWLPLGFTLYLVSLGLSVRHFKTLSFGRLTVNAAVAGGLLAYFLFHHYSASQVYFLLAAILFLWFCALDAWPFVTQRRLRRSLVCFLAAVSLCGTLLTLAPVGRVGAQIALRCLALRPQYPYAQDSVSANDEAAALWLRAHMTQGDIFATNRNAKDAKIGEGTWHYYTAMSGRQAFVESWRYAMDYGMDYTALRHNLEQVSDVIFAQEDAEKAFALAREYNIRYLLVSTPLKAAPFSGAQPVYENAAVRIYEAILPSKA